MWIKKKLNKRKKIRKENIIAKNNCIIDDNELILQNIIANLSKITNITSEIDMQVILTNVSKDLINFEDFNNSQVQILLSLINNIFIYMTKPKLFNYYCNIIYKIFCWLKVNQFKSFIYDNKIFLNYRYDINNFKFETITYIFFKLLKENNYFIYELKSINFFEEILKFIKKYELYDLQKLKYEFCNAILKNQTIENINNYNINVYQIICNWTKMYNSILQSQTLINYILKLWILIFKNNIYNEIIDYDLLKIFILYCLNKYNNEESTISLSLKLIYYINLNNTVKFNINIFENELLISYKITKNLLKLANLNLKFYITDINIVKHFINHITINYNYNFYEIILDYWLYIYKYSIIEEINVFYIINQMIFKTNFNIMENMNYEKKLNKKNSNYNYIEFLYFLDKFIELIYLNDKQNNIDLKEVLYKDKIMSLLDIFNKYNSANYTFEFIELILN